MSIETQWIDDFFDEQDDPIVSDCNLLGLIESLIWNSLFEGREKQEMQSRVDTLRESEVNELMLKLKRNQNIRDPKHQYEAMAKNGMFN